MPINRKYWDNGQKKLEDHWVDGKYHRLDGPAYQCWHKNGERNIARWYVNGFSVSTIHYRYYDHIAYEVIQNLGLNPDDQQWTETDRDMFALHFAAKVL